MAFNPDSKPLKVPNETAVKQLLSRAANRARRLHDSRSKVPFTRETDLNREFAHDRSHHLLWILAMVAICFLAYGLWQALI